MIILLIIVIIILLGLASAIWLVAWSAFEDTELGQTLISKIKKEDNNDQT